MPHRAGLILGQIPHGTELKMLGDCLWGGGGGGGVRWGGPFLELTGTLVSK